MAAVDIVATEGFAEDQTQPLRGAHYFPGNKTKSKTVIEQKLTSSIILISLLQRNVLCMAFQPTRKKNGS